MTIQAMPMFLKDHNLRVKKTLCSSKDFGQIVRMDDSLLAKMLLYGETGECMRLPHHSKKRFKHCINTSLSAISKLTHENVLMVTVVSGLGWSRRIKLLLNLSDFRQKT